MPDVPSAGYGTLFVLVLLIGASVWLGTVAQRVVERGSFVKGYFLGNRGLGAWALALTATVQSGGTFMGFPSLVYSYGWIVALWIAGYMVVPITGFGVLGKRVAQLSRRTGAITVPDLFRERFGSTAVGVVALWFILLYMSFMMVAQFKAGGLIMKVAWPGSGVLGLSEDQAPFQLTAKSLESLRAAGVPGAIVESIEPLANDGFRSAAELNGRLKEVLSAPDFESYSKRIVRESEQLNPVYLLGLVIFSITVVGYTLIGGFLAAVWTDLFQSVMMLVGVAILFVLAIPAAGGVEQATRAAVQATSAEFAAGPGYAVPNNTGVTRDFLPVSLAFSFFFVWVFSGLGSPASVVRIMASKSTEHIRRSIFMLNAYNACIYIPLVIICVCGRALFPKLPPGHGSDEIVPLLTLRVTDSLPLGSLIAGLVLTAPFGAVMATVSGYLVVIASGFVRDVYQRFMRPAATTTEIRRITYVVMIAIGAIAFLANIRPVEYLQAIVVFSGTGAAATFVFPALFTAFWRRSTAAGTLASMIGGGITLIALYGIGFYLAHAGVDQFIGTDTKFRPYYLCGLDPIVWGLLVSALAGVVVSLCTTPPPEDRLRRVYDIEPLQASEAERSKGVS
jgi:Na+/pantothenate symporter